MRLCQVTRLFFVGFFLALGAVAAQAQCNVERLEQFLDKRAFELSADQKIDLYAKRLVRYYDNRDVSRRRVHRLMQQWETRWPERVYKYISIHDYKETEEGDACRVTFNYRFLAYSPQRDKVSAGIGRSTLVLADVEGDGDFRIIGEFGNVRCRGLQKFARSRC
ncbi:MAG: hypothetical protein OEM91_15655 [Hyphomicrobiales bacterium]|nr:hypothetical protein [Hyphomicrobiales bacterium]